MTQGHCRSWFAVEGSLEPIDYGGPSFSGFPRPSLNVMHLLQPLEQVRQVALVGVVPPCVCNFRWAAKKRFSMSVSHAVKSASTFSAVIH
jgi:hypothetical protein